MKPTLVFVHGGFHLPKHFERFADRLTKEGYEVHVPRLPSSGPVAPNCELAGDVVVVRDLVVKLAEESKKVIVTGHSYGGLVAGEAVSGMGYGEREKKGLPGGVAHIIYMAAFLVQPGDSVASVDPMGDKPTIEFFFDKGTCFTAQSPIHLFYGDVEEAIAKEAEENLVPNAIAPLGTPASSPGWPSIPTTYFECTEDRMLSIERQRGCIERARKTGKTIEVVSFKSGHSPWLSLPEEVAAAIVKIAAKYT